MRRSLNLLALTAVFASLPTLANHLEELVVSGSHDTRTVDITDELQISPDIAQLLKNAPGANVNSNGPLTGIPQYRGMYGARVATSVDGANLAPSGPNWMDAPLSYAMGGQLESLEVYRGIVPVSVAMESIGGAVNAKTNQGSFTASEDFSLAGRAILAGSSVNESHQVNTALYASNKHQRLRAAILSERGGDASFPDGEISPTEYQRQRYDLGYGVHLGNHTVQAGYGHNNTGDSGTPALPMDIRSIEGDLYNLNYNFDLESSMHLAASVYGSDLEHQMTNYELRSAPAPANWRRNTATSDNLGFRLSTTLLDENGALVFGFDGFSEEHEANIDNPNNPMFFVTGFNGAKREILGAYMERQEHFSETWRAELGVRYNRVEMDAGEVNGTPAMMMPPAQQLRDVFNAADREQRDNNVDLVAKAWYTASDTSSVYAGVSQKHRSPSYQERYLWLPLEATSGLADGYTYTGNIKLNPEVAHEVEFGLDYSDARLGLSPRLFYREVTDYIQGTPSEEPAAVMFVRMMNNANGTSNPDPLQFNNVDAVLYGFDMDWLVNLSPHWTLSGIVNFVRGERDDNSNDNLYRIAPLNGTFRLNYSAERFSARIESVVYDRQDHVSKTNNEQKTAGYGIVNLHASWQATGRLQFALGIQNLFDREFKDHLAGYNRASNTDIATGERLAGYGTNFHARVLYEF